MTTEQQVATERTVIKAGFGDENTGVVVAAGDVIPAGTGLIQNTPNKVDAAANYDEVDAADKAGAGARPATRVVSSGEGPSQEIVDRVTENRNAWEQESQLNASATPVDASTLKMQPQDQKPEPTPDEGKAPADMTVKELDTSFGSADGYPSKGSKADKVAFAQAQAA